MLRPATRRVAFMIFPGQGWRCSPLNSSGGLTGQCSKDQFLLAIGLAPPPPGIIPPSSPVDAISPNNRGPTLACKLTATAPDPRAQNNLHLSFPKAPSAHSPASCRVGPLSPRLTLVPPLRLDSLIILLAPVFCCPYCDTLLFSLLSQRSSSIQLRVFALYHTLLGLGELLDPLSRRSYVHSLVYFAVSPTES